jgi:benzoyl-CoA reductase/2-hydroxyglutaryl-CoA dehydratase subunit BcrC/BadD/HgdB
MAEEKKPERVAALKDLKQINFFYHIGLHQAREKGVPVCYMNALAPTELCYAMDILPAYPENHAVVIQAKHKALETAEAAEAQGYATDICSYARCDLGYRALGKESSPIGGIPAPNLVLFSSVQCWTIGKWFEEIARQHQVPFFVLDVPVQGRGFTNDPDPYVVDYVVTQLKECIAWLEDHTHRKMDMMKLRATMERSREACRTWWLILESAAYKPAPLTLFDQYQAMAPIVDQRGTQVTVDFYKKLLAECEDRVARKVGGIPDEKYRLYWDGLPLWQSIADFYMILYNRGANLVANNYTRAWAQLAADPDNILVSYATNWLRNYDPMINFRAWDIAESIRRYHLDGFILHSDRSCRFLSIGLADTIAEVTKMTGKPGLLLDTDHGDPRLYQSEQIKSRIDAYLEML